MAHADKAQAFRLYSEYYRGSSKQSTGPTRTSWRPISTTTTGDEGGVSVWAARKVPPLRWQAAWDGDPARQEITGAIVCFPARSALPDRRRPGARCFLVAPARVRRRRHRSDAVL